MKTKTLGIVIALAAILSAQELPIKLSLAQPPYLFNPSTSDELMRLDTSGVYTFSGAATVVRMTKKEIVVEVKVTPQVLVSCAVNHNGQPCPLDYPKPELHRIHFKVTDGLLEYDRVEKATLVPAQPEKWVWEEKKP